MSKIVAGLASSHALALVEPSEWDDDNALNRASYKRRYGVEPPLQPRALEESMPLREESYRGIRDGLEYLRRKLREKKPDALIIVGNDQNENFSEENWPQLAIYLGEECFTTRRHDGKKERGSRYRCHSVLAKDLLNGLVQRGFDVSYSKSFPNSNLLAHAHCQVLDRLFPEAEIPIVLFFVNATNPPIISPARCYQVGRVMKEIIEERPDSERVGIYASGGISHFTVSFPWRHYHGPFTYGCISEEFDRKLMEHISRGDVEALAKLTSRDLIENGDDEMRSWITLLGTIGKIHPELLAYRAIYSARTGMAAAYWELEDAGWKQQISI